MKSKKTLAVWLAIMVLGFAVTSVSGTAILHPGYITGTIDVTGLMGEEYLAGGTVDAYSLTGDFDGHDYDVPGGSYFVTVEGDYEYKVFSKAHIRAGYPSYWYWSTVSIGRQDTYVAVGETVDNFNFTLVPGRIAPIVTVTNAEIQRMVFRVTTDFELPESEFNAAFHDIRAKTGFILNGDESTFPMRPWVSNDANNNGDYTDSGDTYVRVGGDVWIKGTMYPLTPQYIDVIVSETTVVEWSLDFSSSLHGHVVFEASPPTSYYLVAIATIDGNRIRVTHNVNPASQGHDFNLLPGTWKVGGWVYFSHGSDGYNILAIHGKSVTLAIDERKEINWNYNPGYVSGSVNLYGAHGNLVGTRIYGWPPPAGQAMASSPGSDYRLILYEGTWHIGYPYQNLYFTYDDPEIRSDMFLINYGAPQISVEPGTEVSGVDFSYGTATITVNYRVELLGDLEGQLRSPYLVAKSDEGIGADRIVSSVQGWGSDELTTFGKCTITVFPGTHIIGAYAYVEGSYTKFGEFTVTVEAGDVITQDVEAPTVDVTQPGGSEHICGSTVVVAGTATDVSGVGSITVNGTVADVESTGNPDDPNEVSFSTTVEGLVVNKWNIITIVVTDTLGNSITVDRRVYRDPCNLPPEIISISGPLEPVELETAYEMTGTFTDPDIDDIHSAIWDWGDGTTSVGTVDQTERTVTGSHVYGTSGVYTVTLTVTDSFDESDTMTWSQFCVIYDPSAGFVTGGGWIDSPPGADPSDPSLSGKASFGFVSKYKKGAEVPTGTTEFQFKAGDLNFHSDAYDWLLIAGPKAIFKGTGTINGIGSYKFMVTAWDGDLIGDPDRFRIKIWTEDVETGEEFIIYDNGDGGTELGGGSIKIHKGEPP